MNLDLDNLPNLTPGGRRDGPHKRKDNVKRSVIDPKPSNRSSCGSGSVKKENI